MQGEILTLLEKEEKPISRREIGIKLKVENLIKISFAIRKLLKHEEIECIELNRIQAWKHYNCKRRMRLYYVSEDVK